MPIRFNDALDDPLMYDVQTSFIGGQVSNARVNLLTDTQGALLKNVTLDYNGVTESRRGWRATSGTNLYDASSASGTDMQGLFFYDTLAGEKLVACVDRALYEHTPSASAWSQMASQAGSVTPDTPCYFAQIADKLFFSSGVTSETVSQWNGAATASAPTGNGTGLRYITAHGYRLFGATNVDELWASLILPDASATGDNQMFRSNATFRVGKGDGDPITALVPWSDFNLVVFKGGSIHAVNTDPQIVTTSDTGTEVTEFVVRTVSDQIGCVSHRSAVQVDNDIFFLARDGVRSIARTVQDGTHGVSPALSYTIDDVIRRINWSYADKACGAFWRGKYILAIPVDDSTYNNLVIVYDRNLKAWYQWDGFNPVEFCTGKWDGTDHKLYCMDRAGNVLVCHDYQAREKTTSTDYSDSLDGSTNVTPTWEIVSRGFQWGEPINPKLPDAVELEFDRCDAVVDVRLLIDNEDAGAVEQNVETGSGSLNLPFTLPATLGKRKVVRKRFNLDHFGTGREFQIKIMESAGQTSAKNLRLRAMTLSAFVETTEKDE